MIAFTRDFRVLASRFPTDISAVLLPRGNLAQTWDVRTFRRLLIDHLKSCPFQITYEPLIFEFSAASLIACGSPNSSATQNKALRAVWMSCAGAELAGVSNQSDLCRHVGRYWSRCSDRAMNGRTSNCEPAGPFRFVECGETLEAQVLL
jgi:hypothetical protein